MLSDEPDTGQPPHAAHRLIDFLPAIYRRSSALEPFLAAFEAVLFGPTRSVEAHIARIPRLLDPHSADEDEFLPWLAQWAAVTLFHEARDRRRVVAEMIRLYAIRGTREYVKRALELYVDGAVTVDERDLPGMVVGQAARSRVGHGTRLGEDTFGFSVRVDFSRVPKDRRQRLRLIDLACRVIDLAKPAYTHYYFSHNLFDEERGFAIAVRSRVGVDTLLEHGPSRSPERQSR
jgi:phage tail-like protein